MIKHIVGLGFLFCVGCAEPTTEEVCLDFADAVCSTLDRCYYPEYEGCIEFYQEDCSLVTEIDGPVQECTGNIRYGFPTCKEEYPPEPCDDVVFVKEE